MHPQRTVNRNLLLAVSDAAVSDVATPTVSFMYPQTTSCATQVAQETKQITGTHKETDSLGSCFVERGSSVALEH